MSPVARSAGTMVMRPRAVGHVVPHQVARLRHVDRLHQLERGRVLDHAARIARRELDVLDDGIVRIVGIEFAEGAAGERLVLAGAAEVVPLKAGETLLSMTILVTRACAVELIARPAARTQGSAAMVAAPRSRRGAVMVIDISGCLQKCWNSARSELTCRAGPDPWQASSRDKVPRER